MKKTIGLVFSLIFIESFLFGFDGKAFSKVELPVTNVAGQLEEILPQALFDAGGMPIAEVTDFIITGTLNTSDLRYLSGFNYTFSALSFLDLSGATFTEETIDGTIFPAHILPSGAFDGYRTLESVTLPANITILGEKAFAGCSAMKVVPGTITSIGKQAFAWARSVGDFVISEGCREIGDEAFGWCDDNGGMPGLTSIVLPSTLERIGRDAFGGCNRLKTVTLYAVTPPAVNGRIGWVMDGKKTVLYVPDASLQQYMTNDKYSSLFDIRPLSSSGMEKSRADRTLRVSIKDSVLTVSDLTPGSKVYVRDIQGKEIFGSEVTGSAVCVSGNWSSGVYLVTVVEPHGNVTTAKVVR